MATDSSEITYNNSSYPDQKAAMNLSKVVVSRSLVDRIYAKGIFTRQTRLDALRLIEPDKAWGLWALRLLVVLGVGLFLAGVVFFFAFNWAQLPLIVKLGLPQLGFVLCVLGAVFLKLPGLLAQMSLIGASIFTGVFLAVFGQAYQTGADAFQLFLAWSVLILPFVLLSRFAAHWIVWMVIVNVFLSLWAVQSPVFDAQNRELALVLVALFNALMLILFEAQAERQDWLKRFWSRPLLLIFTIAPAFLLIGRFISAGHWNNVFDVGPAIVGVVAHILAFVFYRFVRPQLSALSMVLLSTCLLAMYGLGHFLDSYLRADEGLMFLVMTLSALGIFSLAIYYLYRLNKKLEVAHD